MRRGAVAASVPVEVVEAEGGAAARAKIAANDIDVVFADAAIPAAERAAFIAAGAVDGAEAVRVPRGCDHGRGADALPAAAPTASSSSRRTPSRPRRWSSAARGCGCPIACWWSTIRSTMRSIVRKILVASRFRLDIAEAQEGVDALKQIASGKFDLVFLDYNMPGLNGVETLAEIKRQYPNLHVVIMTSTADDALAERARRAGAAAFLKKPFYPADIDAILHRIFGLQVRT